MAHYAIGDLQGCHDELQDLLALLRYDHQRDRLWFCGDLINRGPQSLKCLRFVMQCPGAETVLGNHDLHLLAVANGVRATRPGDTFEDILQDARRQEYIDWLRTRPLLLYDREHEFHMVHAGIHPHWDLAKARHLARELGETLSGEDYASFLCTLYQGETPLYSSQLSALARRRLAIDVFTRMRFLDPEGSLIHHNKASPNEARGSDTPWYRFPGRASAGSKLLFGHWSTVTLGGHEDFASHRVYPLDHGCIWGGRLTALRLNDEKWFSVPSRQPRLASRMQGRIDR